MGFFCLWGAIRLCNVEFPISNYNLLEFVFCFITTPFFGKRSLSSCLVMLWQEGTIVYERTSHPFAHKNVTPCRFVADSSQMIMSRLFWGPFNWLQCQSDLKKSPGCMLFEGFHVGWMKIWSHTIIPSLHPLPPPSHPSCCFWRLADICNSIMT